ncbi:excisionase family DNA-binding protein [Nesterenkonia jeotgali]|uniref:Excisionase family DNA binding protein n=1 Tax=Nesterenkonia jeotgali TaxID=317018 RepID=A0A839FKN3_9MICC|nr:excisionase family DNA binding protein [Nesterenkonia jeotgali]
MTVESVPHVERLAYSYQQAADRTGYSVSHIRRMVREGHLRSVSPAGSSKPVITRESLELWISSGR